MKKYFKIVALAALVVTLGSCLKDKKYDEGLTGLNLANAPKVIELAQAYSSARGRTVGLAYVDQTINAEFVTVRLAATNPAAEDIKVTLDTTGAYAYIQAYNATNSLAIEKLPNSFFTFPNGLTVTIPAGSREGSLLIRTNAIAYNTSTTYALFFKIASVANAGYVASGNFNEYFTQVGAKNKYDGVYKVTGSFVDLTNATFTGNYPREYSLVTTGANTVDVKQIINGSLDPGYLFLAGTGGSFFGSFGLSIIFDPVTDNVLEIRNYYGVTSNAATQVGTPSAGSGAPLYAGANTRRIGLDGTGTNYYDAASKIVNLKYLMYQPSIAATAAFGGVRCKFTEVLTYDRAR
jgi:hypothetical protein